MTDIALNISFLVVIGCLCQWLAWRTKLPAILYLIIVGFAIGPVFGVFNPNEMFGDLVFPMTSIGVAIILFEGSLTLKLQEIKNFGKMIRNLITIGVAVTWLGMSLAAYYFSPLSLEESFLFGALVSVTGPTVIAPMVRSIQPSSKITNILRWEGIIVDPIGAILGLLVLVFIESNYQASSALLEVFKAFVVGGVLGYVGGLLIANIIREHWAPEYLLNFITLSLVLIIFTGSNVLVHESGLIAVTIMGIYLANKKDILVEHILHFKEHLSILIISMLFLMLSARIEFEALKGMAVSGLIILLIAQFIVRPLSIWISAIGTKTETNEKWLLSWIAPRGIIAAAISAVFADRLVQFGYESAANLVPLCFMVIIGTVVIQSATGKKLALKLGLSDANSQGVLLININRVSLAIANALTKAGITVRMVDDKWSSVREARMQDISVFYGDPLSEKAEFELDMSGIKNLISLSSRSDQNKLTCTHFRPYFEPKNLLTIMTKGEDEVEFANKHKYAYVFDEETSWQNISDLLSSGWEFRCTKFSKDYTLEQYMQESPKDPILFATINPKGELMLGLNLKMEAIEEKWTGIFLAPAKDNEKKLQDKIKESKERETKNKEVAENDAHENDAQENNSKENKSKENGG